MPISRQSYNTTLSDTAECVCPDFFSWRKYLERLSFQKGSLDHDTFRACLRAASCGIPRGLAVGVCRRLIEAAGDVANLSKIERQATRAYEVAKEGRPLNPRAERVEYDPDFLAEFIAGSEMDEVELSARSPTPLVAVLTPHAFLSALFSPTEYVLVFTNYKSQGQALWPLDELPQQGPDGVWFLCNPVDGQEHPNPRMGGKPSSRSREAITAFRFAVIETDIVEPENWLQVLVRLPIRIAAVYTSGRRSIHALVRLDAESNEHWESLISPHKSFLTRLGADPGCFRAVQLTRLPGTKRGPGIKQPTRASQRLLYLNPSPDGTPIEYQARLRKL